MLHHVYRAIMVIWPQKKAKFYLQSSLCVIARVPLALPTSMLRESQLCSHLSCDTESPVQPFKKFCRKGLQNSYKEYEMVFSFRYPRCSSRWHTYWKGTALGTEGFWVLMHGPRIAHFRYKIFLEECMLLSDFLIFSLRLEVLYQWLILLVKKVAVKRIK